jgi:thioredoxin 1
VPTVALTKDTFNDTVAGHDIVLVDWWAIWCPPCSTFAQVFEAAADRHPDVVFGKVDTEAETELASAARITSIPTVMAFREGVLVYSQPGALPPAAVDELVSRVRALDMDEVRAALAS